MRAGRGGTRSAGQRLLAAAAALMGLLVCAPAASAQDASITDFFNACPTYDAQDRQRICSAQVPSFDGMRLDVDLTLPFNDERARDHPLIVMMNGFSNDKHEWQSVTDEGDGADKYHWNSHWFAKHGYYVLTYTPRGFHSEQADNAPWQPPTPAFSSVDEPSGTIHLKSREFEIRDTQWLAALVADAFDVDEDRIAVTGGSYGGGESWLQASQAEWTFPAACSRADVDSGPEACRPSESERRDFGALAPLRLQVAVPKYPWTDLAYSLAPNGHPGPDGTIYDSAQHSNQKQAREPCFSSAVSEPPEDRLCNPFGVLKKSYVDGFYLLGNGDGVFEDGDKLTPSEEGPINIHCWKARGDGAPFLPMGEPPPATCQPTGDPYDVGGVEDAIVQQLRDGLTEYRGAYYQDQEWAEQVDGRKVAIFSIQGWTDDLFTAVESFRMFRYLKELDPRWPVGLELADVGHPRAQNKPETWRRLNARAFQFLSAHLNGSHEQRTTVSSQPTLCENDGDRDSNETAAQRLTAQSPVELSRGVLEISYEQGGATNNPLGATDPNGLATDPVFGGLFPVPGLPCRQSDGPALGGYTAVSESLPSHTIYVGLGYVTVPYVLTGTTTATLNARVWDVSPDGETQLLMTRGTYRIDAPAYDRPAGTLTLPLFGNHWPLAPGHRVRLDLTQVDAPFLRPSNLPSTIDLGPPTLTLPTRDSGTLALAGARASPPIP
jgi:predicted acyl esterase